MEILAVICTLIVAIALIFFGSDGKSMTNAIPEHTHRRSPIVAGITGAIWWGAMVFYMGVTATLFDQGTSWIALLSTDGGGYYRGYEATWTGTLIGTVWAIVDGFVTGVLLSFFHIKASGWCGYDGVATAKKNDT